MEQLLNNYGKLIDQLRKDRNMSREDLCDEIMSVRNFQRFSSGEISISHDKIIKLIDKLNCNYYSLNQAIIQKSDPVLQKLYQADEMNRSWDNDKAKLILASIDKNEIKSDYVMFYYNYVEIMSNRQNKPNEDLILYKKLIEFVDYPNIISLRYLNSIEVNALIFINTYMCKKNDDTILLYFETLLKNSGLGESMLTQKSIMLIYSSVVKGYHILKNYTKSLIYCEKAIEHSLKNDLNSTIAMLFGQKALAEHSLNLAEKSIISAKKMYMQLLIEDNEKKTETFTSIINNALGIVVQDYIK